MIKPTAPPNSEVAPDIAEYVMAPEICDAILSNLVNLKTI